MEDITTAEDLLKAVGIHSKTASALLRAHEEVDVLIAVSAYEIARRRGGPSAPRGPGWLKSCLDRRAEFDQAAVDWYNWTFENGAFPDWIGPWETDHKEPNEDVLEHPAVQAYLQHFQDDRGRLLFWLIPQHVEEMEVWTSAMEFWGGNCYDPAHIHGLLNLYYEFAKRRSDHQTLSPIATHCEHVGGDGSGAHVRGLHVPQEN